MSVGTLSNHYELLRVAATATTAEIAEAFASQMRMVRVRPDMTVARIAQLSLAYETLRDPAKRRAYDSSIGLNRQPPPAPLNIASFVAGSYGPATVRHAPPTPPKQEPARPDVPAEPRVAAFIAASLREPAPKREPEAAPAPAPTSAPEVAVAPRRTTVDERLAVAARPILIDRTRANIGAGVVGLAVLALAVSLPKANADRLSDPVTSAQTVTVGLPPATPVQDYVVPPQAIAAERQEVAPVVAQAEEPTAPEEQQPQTTPSEQPPVIDAPPVAIAAVDPLAPTPAVDAATETPVVKSDAKMPLPNATIARTIERIGYSCGSVSSVVADAGPGVFKVNCSSGDSYRAAPTGGRYHFRRWDRR
jgi:hypothetical protein